MNKEILLQPEITVIIPVYNVEEYVSECLDSVLSQTVKNIEVICIDDGSTDFSLGILQNYQRIDARIKIITQENQGVFAARNNGIDAANGKYICFMDPDDWYPTIDVLETLLRAVKISHVKIAGGSWSSFQNGNIKEEFTGNNAGYTMRMEGVVDYNDYQFDYGFQRFLYEREFLISNNVKFPAYRRYQDPVFFVKAMTLAGKFYATTKVVYRYRESYKEIDWTEEKLCHLIMALTDNFTISKNNCLDVLHYNMYNRLVNYHIGILKKLLHINPSKANELFLKLQNSIDIAFVKKFNNAVDENNPVPNLFQILFYEGVPEKNDDPKVSIVLPIYNVEKYLRQSVNSAINQTLQDIEIILVDDGSTDASPQIADEYANKDSRVKVIHKKNGGLSSARNAGVRIARGKYVYYLDSDDYIAENAMEILYEKAEENDLDMVFFNADSFLDEDDQQSAILQRKARGYLDYYKRNGDYNGVMKGKDLFCKMHSKGEHRSSVCIQFIKRKFCLLKNLFFYEGILQEDNLYTLKAILCAERTMFIPQTFFHRRVRANSIMTQPQGYKNFYGYFVTYCEALRFISDNNFTSSINKEVIDEINNCYRMAAIRLWKKISTEERKKFVSQLTIFQKNLWETVEEIEIKKNAARENMNLKKQIKGLKNSVSFKVGRVLTWAPRKIRGGVKCLSQHGIGYTIKRTIEHFGIDMGTGDFRKR